MWTYVFNSFDHVPRNTIVRAYGNSMFYSEELPNCFPSSCSILHFHQQCVRGLVSPHPC